MACLTNRLRDRDWDWGALGQLLARSCRSKEAVLKLLVKAAGLRKLPLMLRLLVLLC